MSACDEMFELQDRTCEALILGFKPENILAYDFYIPSPSKAQDIIREAIPKSYGKRNFNTEEGRREFGDRLTRGIHFSFFYLDSPGPYSDSSTYFTQFFLEILDPSERMFSREFFADFGDLRKFRVGEREKAQKRVESYFNRFELEKIRKIQETMERVEEK